MGMFAGSKVEKGKKKWSVALILKGLQQHRGAHRLPVGPPPPMVDSEEGGSRLQRFPYRGMGCLPADH